MLNTVVSPSVIVPLDEVAVAVRVGVAVRVAVGVEVAPVAVGGGGVEVAPQVGGGLDGFSTPPATARISASVMRGKPRKSMIMLLASKPLPTVPKCPSATRKL